MPRLIWVFAGRTVILLVLPCHGSDFFLTHPSNTLYSSLTNNTVKQDIFVSPNFRFLAQKQKDYFSQILIQRPVINNLILICKNCTMGGTTRLSLKRLTVCKENLRPKYLKWKRIKDTCRLMDKKVILAYTRHEILISIEGVCHIWRDRIIINDFLEKKKKRENCVCLLVRYFKGEHNISCKYVLE